ncbi:MAG: ABC transporter permease [bacterium]|nr:ABC transporter permease [bacterium]
METVSLAFAALKANKLRSLLTMLGVIIGVSSVILLVSLGAGLQGYISQQFEVLGSNILIVLPGKMGDEEGGFGGMQGPPNLQGSKLTLEHVRDLEKMGEPITAASPVFELASEASYGINKKTVTLFGVTDQYEKVRKFTVVSGRGLTRADLDSSRKVAVIGPSLAEKLFGETDPLGKKFTLSQRKFEVVGVTEKLGSLMGVDIDNIAYIPITTAQKVIGFENLMEILVKVDENDNIDAAQAMLKNYFLRQLTSEDFSIMDQRQILNIINQILGVLTLALGGIAAISLVVGGVGIMNIMLVSVTERTREIGLRKAVGATPEAILFQFLSEAVILAFTGGLLGVVLGVGGSLLLSRFLPTVVPLWSIILSFTVSAGVGIIFGVAPAAKAAKLSPITALRYE